MQSSPIITILILIISSLFSRSSFPPSVARPTPMPSVSPSAAPSQTPSQTPLPVKPIIRVNPSPANIGSGFQYPKSTLVSPGVYQSSDTPDQITLWYKNKIKSLGYSANSFVQTNTNGNVLNKLVGSNGSSSLSVEISKSSSSTATTITIHS